MVPGEGGRSLRLFHRRPTKRVTNRQSRKWLNNHLLLELVLCLNSEDIEASLLHLHGFYNLTSVTVSTTKDAKLWKMTTTRISCLMCYLPTSLRFIFLKMSEDEMHIINLANL